MERLINSIGSGMIMTDEVGRIQSINRAAESILGYRADELTNRLIDREIELHSEGQSPLLLALEQRKNQDRIDTIFIKKSGERIYAGASVYLLMEPDLVGAVEIFRDLSEIKANERKQRLAALEEMAAEVAHEIYNPLGGIKGFASMLARKSQKDPGRHHIEQIIEGISNIEQVVKNFLLYARPMIPCLSIADLHQLLDACLDQNISVGIERSYGEDVPKLAIDVEQMQRAFMNVVTAVIHAMSENSTLRVKTRAADADSVQVIITDAGLGSPANVSEQIFDPFYTTKKTGTGLGLALASRIIEAHHGKIYVQLDGARVIAFVIELPIHQATAAIEARQLL